MRIIKVADFIPNAFSNDQAEVLKGEIEKLLNIEDKIVIDFEGITKYTTLFFNFSTGYFINRLGKDKYDSIFEIRNLNPLGESTYNHSYNNSIRDELKSDYIREKIWDILNSTND